MAVYLDVRISRVEIPGEQLNVRRLGVGGNGKEIERDFGCVAFPRVIQHWDTSFVSSKRDERRGSQFVSRQFFAMTVSIEMIHPSIHIPCSVTSSISLPPRIMADY